jgi:hypothetical protein
VPAPVCVAGGKQSMPWQLLSSLSQQLSVKVIKKIKIIFFIANEF